jgi:hypothetical protein
LAFQDQVPLTWTCVDINLLDLAQESDHGKNVSAKFKIEIVKKINLKTGKDIYVKKVDFFQNLISRLNFIINY